MTRDEILSELAQLEEALPGLREIAKLNREHAEQLREIAMQAKKNEALAWRDSGKARNAARDAWERINELRRKLEELDAPPPDLGPVMHARNFAKGPKTSGGI